MITLHFNELYLAFLSTRLQFEAAYLSYTRSSSRKSSHLFWAYKGLDLVSDTLHVLFFNSGNSSAIVEYIICSIEYTILEVSQIQLWILIKLCKVHHYFHSTDEKLKSRDVKSLTQAKELANGRAKIQTQKEHSFCIRLCTHESIYVSFLSMSFEWVNLLLFTKHDYLMLSISQCYYLFNLIYPETCLKANLTIFYYPDSLTQFTSDTCLSWLNLKGWHSSSFSIQISPQTPSTFFFF